MGKYIQKFVSILIVITTILASSVTYTKLIQAEESEERPILAYAYRDDYEGGKLKPIYYVDDIAISASLNYTIILNQDIEVTHPFTVQGTWLIKMNGHKFYRPTSYADNNGFLFELNAYANLTLLGEGDDKLPTTTDVKNTVFTYRGFRKDDSESTYTYSDMTVTAGGLLTGGHSTNKTGAIYMNANSTLNLSNVAINGNGTRSESAHGAINIVGKNCTINLDNSHIDHNYAEDYGGGIAIEESGSASIYMNDSSVDYNISADSGGGIVALGPLTFLTGNYNSSVSHNYAKRFAGGIGIEVDEGSGNIKQLNVTDNQAGMSGGGIDIMAPNIILDDCTIKGNTTHGYGGGIFVDDKGTIIRNCKITDNHTLKNSEEGDTTGGGIYVFCQYDVTMYGKNIVENNFNSKNNQDNVYLDDASFLAHAYIRGIAYEGSHIGITCDYTSSQKVGINITDYIEGTYFLDNPDNLHLEYNSSTKELYQKEGSGPKYSLIINGMEVGKYYSGELVCIADNIVDKEKVFTHWDYTHATGINLTTEQRTQRVFVIPMPGNDVVINALHFDRLTSLTLRVIEPKPTANRELPDWIQYIYGPEDDTQRRWTEDIEWLEVNEDGSTTPTSGIAKYDTSYALKFQLAQDFDKEIAFSETIKPENITINFSDGTTIKAASVTLDEAGTITIISESIHTDSKVTTVTSFDEEYLTVQKGIGKEELISLLPSIAIGTDTDEDKSDYEVDKDNIPDDTFDSLMEDGVITNSGTIALPVKEKDGVVFADTAVFNVTITVEEDIPEPTEEIATPTVSKESALYTGTSLKVEASTTTTDATIYYTIDNGDKTEYKSEDGIVLTTNTDKAQSFFVNVWAEKDDNVSTTLHLWYILDGRTQKTVMITCLDTSLESWSDTITKSYTSGTKVAIYAPTYTGRAFEKWIYTNSDGEQVESTDLSIKFDSLDSDQEVQAIYNPVLSSVSINIPYPQANTDLALKDQISVTGTIGNQTKDITAHFDLDHFTWLPNDTIADYETSYTAKLPITHTESIHYVLADNIEIMVNGNSDPNLIVHIDKGYTNVYITFPKTEDRPDEPEPSVKPTDEPTPTATPETKKSTSTPTSGWDDGGPFTTDKCGNVYDRWGNKIYEAKGCNVGGYNLVQTDTKD